MGPWMGIRIGTEAGMGTRVDIGTGRDSGWANRKGKRDYRERKRIGRGWGYGVEAGVESRGEGPREERKTDEDLVLKLTVLTRQIGERERRVTMKTQR